MELHYYSKNTPNMGYRPPPESPDESYAISISNDQILLNGIPGRDIHFIEGKTYLFRQNDPSAFAANAAALSTYFSASVS